VVNTRVAASPVDRPPPPALPPVGRGLLHKLPRVVLAGLMAVAIVNLLIGVFLRYVMTEITNFLDVDMVRYTWVEEVGEFALAWMTLIGAAIGIREGVHFTLHLGVQRLPRPVQRAIAVANGLLIAGFGVLAAWHGWGLSMLNTQLESPALEINLGWLYGAAVAGGALIAAYGLASARAAWRDAPAH
jgi:TRAP-type C4-dicarboxylate transport system permease small subunit